MTKTIEVPIHGNAITTAVRNLYKIQDMDGMRKLFRSEIDDEILVDIGTGHKKIVGDSKSGFKVVST